MNAYTELAQLFKARDNPAGYSPILGVITDLPELRIRAGTDIWYDAGDIKCIFDIFEKTHYDDGWEEYVYLNKTAVLLPYGDGQKVIAIGVIQE